MPFWWVLMMKFCIKSAYKNWLDFQFFADFPLKCKCVSLHSTYKIFQKKKKKKKESHHIKWKVSKKQVFQKKYYPIRDWNRLRVVSSKCSTENVWVEIFSETWKAWTCFFVNLELNLAFFLFIFCFEYPNQLFFWKRIKSWSN